MSPMKTDKELLGLAASTHRIIVCGNDRFGFFVRECRQGLGWAKLAGPFKHRKTAEDRAAAEIGRAKSEG